jgi:hypothetical protein
LPGKQRPSFLKRQKEQKRLARAAAKREERRVRKQGKAGYGDDPEAMEPAVEGAVAGESPAADVPEGGGDPGS